MVLFCAFFYSPSAWSQDAEAIPGDFDANGQVEFADFLTFASGFGKTSTDLDFDTRLDLGGNGTIDFEDFLIFAQNFGKSSSNGSQTPTDPPVETPTANLVYIADLTGDKIDVLDITTNLIDPSRTIFVSQPRGIAFSEINKHIYVASVDNFFILSDTGTPVFTIPLDPLLQFGQPDITRGGFKVVLSPDHKLAYVTEETAGLLEVFDTIVGESKALIPVPSSPGGLAIDPSGQNVYVAHGTGAATLSIIDAVQHTLKDSISVSDILPSRLAMAPDGSRLYLNNALTGQVNAINLATKSIVASFTAGEPTDLSTWIVDLGLTADGSRLVVTLNRIFQGTLGSITTLEFAGSVLVIDTATMTQSAEIPIGQLAASMGVSPDGKTAYVAGATDIQDQATSNLQVFIIDLETNASLGSIRGLSLPVEFKFRAGKPVLNLENLPDIVVF